MLGSSKFTIFAVLKQNKCSMKVVKVSKIIHDLEKAGWRMDRMKGSHREYVHPTKKGTVTVNGKKSDDVCGFLLKSIERQSGLKF